MTESPAPTTPSTFTAEHEDLLEYRELSRLAVVGLVLGLFSILALFTSILWVVPVVAIAINLVAWYQISRSETLTGKSLAVVGLALAALFFGGSVTQTTLQKRWLVRDSRQMAQGWLELILEKKFLQAHQLTVHPDGRQPPTASLAAYYTKDETTQEALHGFETGPAIRAIEFWDGGPLEARFVRDGVTSVYEGVDYARHLFQVVEKETGQPLWDVEVTMKRYPPGGNYPNQFVWTADSISLEKTHNR